MHGGPAPDFKRGGEAPLTGSPPSTTSKTSAREGQEQGLEETGDPQSRRPWLSVFLPSLQGNLLGKQHGFGQTSALVHRNFSIMRRDFRQLLRFVVTPALYLIIIVVMSNVIPPAKYPMVPAQPVPWPIRPLPGSPLLAFGPSSNPIVGQVASWITNVSTCNLCTFASATPVLVADPGNLSSLPFLTSIYALVDLSNTSAGNFASNMVSITLRFNSSLVPSTFPLVTSPLMCRSPGACSSSAYVRSGFLDLQAELASALSSIVAPLSTKLSISGHVGYLYQPQYFATQSWLGLLLGIYTVLCFWPLVSTVIIYIVTEKEKKLKEGLLVNGMSESPYLSGYFIAFGLITVIATILMALLVNLGVLKHSNFFLVWLQLFLYGMSSIGYAFCLSSFFNHARVASGLGTSIAIALAAIYVPIYLAPPSASGLWAICLLSPVALALGMGQSFTLDSQMGGLQFSNLWFSVASPDFSVGACIIMLIIDCVFYLTLALYLDQVVPSTYGPKRPPLFFLHRSFWTKPAAGMGVLPAHSAHAVEVLPPNDDVELLAPSDAVAISIRSLVKIYPGAVDKTAVKTPALDGISLDIPADSIFGLIGHNGSGKTTLISILCGLFPPTSGKISMFGMDASSEMHAIRREIGFCPQHDLLFEHLTVREHVQLFCRLKNQPMSRVDELLGHFNLVDSAQQVATTLSGGQKRKLSVCMALAGNSRILLLDEPTAGMDVFARAQLWRSLYALKAGKVIIVASHILEELDTYATRKVILDKGKVVACGSSFFLKSRFQTGYRIVVDEGQAASIVQEKVPSALAQPLLGERISFLVQQPENVDLAGLFSALDDAQVKFNLHLTSLEDVFLQLGRKRNQAMDSVLPVLQPSSVVQPSIRTQLLSLLRHKFLLVRNNPSVYSLVVLSVVVIQVIGLVIGLFSASSTASPSTESAPLDLSTRPTLNSRTIPVLNYSTASIDPWVSLLGSGFALQAPLSNNTTNATFLNAAINISASPPWGPGLTLAVNSTWVSGFPSVWGSIVSASFQANTASNASLNFVSNPLPGTSTSTFQGNVLGSALVFGVTMVIVPLLAGYDVVKERQVKVRHLLAISGLDPLAYWGATMARDLVFCVIPAISLIVLVLAFQLPCLIGNAMLPLVLLLVLFLFSSLLGTYILSHFFSSADTYMMATTMMGTFLVILPYLAVALLDQLGYATVAEALQYVLVAINPFYGFMGGIYFICAVNPLGKSPSMATYFDFASVISGTLLIILGQIVFMVVYIGWIELHAVVLHEPNEVSKSTELDPDVLLEKARLQQRECSDMVQVKGVSKIFPAKPRAKVAVDDLWFGVPVGECFGLLGPNGSGKTVAISVLTGELIPTSGLAMVEGIVAGPASRRAMRGVAYCPQIDALYEDLTCEEHLRLFGTIKGVQGLEDRIAQVIALLGMQPWQHQAIKALSGGTKRKVQMAITVLANPSLLVLDEPTAGMDPTARHAMWACIRVNVVNRSCILTTHSMDEAEELCSRIGVLVKGRLRAIGTSQHLKDKFGRGYRLELKIKLDAVDTLEQFMTKSFGQQSQIVSKESDRVLFSIGSLPCRLGEAFAHLEEAKREGWLVDYQFSEATLEQVFQAIVLKNSN